MNAKDTIQIFLETTENIHNFIPHTHQDEINQLKTIIEEQDQKIQTLEDKIEVIEANVLTITARAVDLNYRPMGKL